MSDDESYKIIRFNFDPPNEVVETGLTLEEAREHCQREDTHGDGWFDGYDLEDPSDEVLAQRAEADERLRHGIDALGRLGL
jgi:hypothetical protein